MDSLPTTQRQNVLAYSYISDHAVYLDAQATGVRF